MPNNLYHVSATIQGFYREMFALAETKKQCRKMMREEYGGSLATVIIVKKVNTSQCGLIKTIMREKYVN